MKFTKAIDIHTADPAKLQPGQWVYAGQDHGPGSPSRGRFIGITKGGAVVVAWMGNARSWRGTEAGIAGYLKSLQSYARAYA